MKLLKMRVFLNLLKNVHWPASADRDSQKNMFDILNHGMCRYIDMSRKIMEEVYSMTSGNIIYMLLFSVISFSCNHSTTYRPPKDPLFTNISASQSGIRFRNDVMDDSTFNVLNYRNFYNGGGVAIGDVNNDGLADVFFTSNQGKNKLFLNKGNFQFEDITEKSGIIKKMAWSTGVTMADVNGDGLLDIYVCAAGNTKGDFRENELYINQGVDKYRIPHFKEMAAKYKLQDSGGLHTQAVFFDYDGDGDLDVFLLNNNGLMPTGNYGNGSIRNILNPGTGDKLLRNDNGVFTDVTMHAGIYGSGISFGLGVTVGDVNGDKWPDLYVSNDFFEKDYLYINQRDGTFKEMSDSLIGHMSQSSMGADMADINNDGLIDIFSTDMLPEDDYRLKKNTRFEDYDVNQAKFKAGYHHQFLSNMLHLNNGDKTFSEIAQYAGVNATDWSWGALIFDCNNDGWKDITVCNGMYLDVTDQDYVDFTENENNKKLFGNNRNPMNYEQLKSMMTSVPLSKYEFINQKNLTFKNESLELGLGEPGYSNGAAYADLDNDGDLDLIVNNINSDCSVYRNNTSEKFKKSYLRVKLKGRGMNQFGIGAEVTLYAGGMQQVLQNFPSRGFQSCVEPVLTFGMDTVKIIDSLVVIWPDMGKQSIKNLQANREVILQQKDAKEKFVIQRPCQASLFQDVTNTGISGNIRHKENDFNDFKRDRLMPHMLSTEGPKIAVGDVNGDGLEDFFIGGAKHDTGKIFVQTKSGAFKQLLPEVDLAADNNYESVGAAFLDADGDGDLDLIVTSGGNLEKEGSELLQPRLYLNDGKGLFTRSKDGLPFISVNASCVAVYDYDGDGYQDLFIGGRNVPGEYGVSPRSYLLHNEKGRFIDVTAAVAPQLQNIGMVTDAIWQDIDNDGKKDLIIVGEWMPITIFSNDGKQLKPSPLNNQFAFTSGWWNCIKAADLDNDGNIDFVVGNLGLNTKIKADSLHPAQVYINDFDNNGRKESVITYYKKDGKSYPYHLKSDMVEQIPLLKKKFLKYSDYAGKTINEIFDKNQLENAVIKNAYQFKTCIIYNEGKGKFHVEPLPVMAQISPVYAILIDDFDGDNKKDIFLAGNFYGLKPELGRYDANFGVVFRCKEKHQFEFLPPSKSGLFYCGEVRNVIGIKTADKKKTILLAHNNDKLQIFKKE